MQSVLERITPVVLTYNEEENIGRTLRCLRWAKAVVVVDSESTDKTETIAASFCNVRFVKRKFDNHARQWNFAIHETGINTDWILALDADYVVSDALLTEIEQLNVKPGVNGYEANFTYRLLGADLRGTVYPPVTMLYRRAFASYHQCGHTQRLVLAGEVRRLKNTLGHDDRKPVSRWLRAQQAYAKLEADYLTSVAPARLRWIDRLRLMGWPAPFLAFVYVMLAKRCVFDGRPGLLYGLQRMLAEAMIAIEINDRALRAKDN